MDLKCHNSFGQHMRFIKKVTLSSTSPWEQRPLFVPFVRCVAVHINNAVVVVCNEESHWSVLVLLNDGRIFLCILPTSGVDRPKFCEKCDKKEDGVEDEEEDPVAPTQVEAAQWDVDEGQHQRQPQSSREDPRQQALRFELWSGKEEESCWQNRRGVTHLLILWLTWTSDCVLIICTRHPKPTPNSMSVGIWVKEAVTKSVRFHTDKLVLLETNKDTENDASEAGRYRHLWVPLLGNGDVREAICQRDGQGFK